MGKGSRQIVILLLLTLVTFIYLNGTRIFQPPMGLNANLSNLKYFGVGETWNSLIFGDHKHWTSMQHYVNLMDEYERQRNYGLLDQNGEMQYMQRFSDAASNAVRSWQTYQIRQAGRLLSEEADEYFGLESLKRSKSPVLLLGVLAAAYSGRTIRYRLGGGNLLESKTTITNSQFDEQYMGMRSSVLEASAGARYGNGRKPAFVVQKQLTREVSLNYEQSDERSVGVTYSRGF